MAQMWLLWWPKPTSTVSAADAATTTNTGVDSSAKATPTTSTTSSIAESAKNCSCVGLKRLMNKLKKQGRMLRAAMASRQASIQCRYDPMSYSLNFDTSGCGSLLDDEDYYQFCAFSSRFVANPRTSCPRLATSRYNPNHKM